MPLREEQALLLDRPLRSLSCSDQEHGVALRLNADSSRNGEGTLRAATYARMVVIATGHVEKCEYLRQSWGPSIVHQSGSILRPKPCRVE